VQSDAGADPGLVDVEIDTHHFALTHPHEVVDQSWMAIVLWPNKHHPDFGLRLLAIDSWDKRSVVDLLLQNPVVGGF